MRLITPGYLLTLALEEAAEQNQRVADWINVAPGTLSKYCHDNLPLPNEVIGRLADTIIGQTTAFWQLQELVLRNTAKAINYRPDRDPSGGALCRRQKRNIQAVSKAA
ncbi:MAG: hypothetical protein ACYDG6_11355 [Thermincolia bacterium]